jgi:hypothetical protein
MLTTFQIAQECLVVVRADRSAGGGVGRSRLAAGVPAIDRPEHAVQDGRHEQQVHHEPDHPSRVRSPGEYPDSVKHFLVYTALRIALFVGVYAVLVGIAAAFGAGKSSWIWLLIGAAVISSGLSLKLLNGPRERFALSVQQRAERAAAKVEEMRAREDADRDAE